MERPHRRVGLLGPVILIGLGIIFLLNNLGLLEWTVWEALLRLWPVLIIGIGLDLLIGRRSIWGSLLVVVLVLGLAAGAVALYESRPRGAAGFDHEVIEVPLEGASEGEVNLDLSVGRLEVQDAGASDLLVEGEVALRSGENLRSEARSEGETIFYSLSSDLREWRGISFPGSWLRDRLWTLSFNREIPLRVTIDVGVGEVIVDLSGLAVRELDLNGGVGRMVVTLPEGIDAEIRMDLGVGENVLRVPEGVGVRVRAEGGLAPVTTPSGYTRSNGIYTSPNYGTAESRVDVEISAGVGAIVIREVATP
jgi:hypothetical protein